MGIVKSFVRATDAQIAEVLSASDKLAVLNTFLFDDDDLRDDTERVCTDKAWHALHFLLNGKAYGGEPPLDFIIGGANGRAIVGEGMEPMHAFFSDEVKKIAAALQEVTAPELGRRFVPSKMAEMAMAEIYPEQLWSPSDRYVSENRQGVMCLIRLESRPPLTRSDYEFIDEHIDGMREYLVWHFECLRAFVLESANRGVGLISL